MARAPHRSRRPKPRRARSPEPDAINGELTVDLARSAATTVPTRRTVVTTRVFGHADLHFRQELATIATQQRPLRLQVSTQWNDGQRRRKVNSPRENNNAAARREQREKERERETGEGSVRAREMARGGDGRGKEHSTKGRVTV